MSSVTLTVGPVTFAIKCKKMLSRHGIKSKLIKVDTGVSGGCEYGIEIQREHFYTAVIFLREEGISYKVYKE